VRGPLLTARVFSGEVILYERDGNIFGYAVIRSRAFLGRDFVELLAVAVDERRRGVASLLLNEAVLLSSTARIFTSTNQSNLQMIRLLGRKAGNSADNLKG
jgi:hypothetical protein